MDTSLLNRNLLVPAIIVLVILLGISIWGLMLPRNQSVEIQNFNQCAAAGNQVMESYPRQCRSADGRLFVEEITPPVSEDMSSLIVVETPQPNKLVTSPLFIEGRARGSWFFEASFPLRLFDGNGKEILVTPVQAQDEWMTEDFVPFSIQLTFEMPETDTGTLVFQKDNPSGLPEYDKQLEVPIRFKPDITKACVPTGCSGQVCSDTKVFTTCEYKPEYACYKNAICERQADGVCGWTENPMFTSCIQKNKTSGPALQ
ncbi:MAG: hypothetical protein A3F24_00190 [Candidatus Colwellbacteria bacterium RIFCSPHIGHO2_12_FULL_44_17]|uniref:Bacterial spore germination immunoglobulin-like domain-containing protein n=2 Tax=Candidatus Colwelliibacteriota TaxID=1817904 RepID=A0A1G1Z6L8_9BACT|nr:MAG: hypothetical protein A3I31_02260 [Candidatus Colwellbacteria bacterium RIFCSPLOWO2_02_FULL_44_20b]OGY59890.1 MAG: hypothetical protein A3F24_00190 [Candidatus Colwellbacteria bacterium RIFCSPHIGHO2_12_FULL_44_17]